MTFLELKNVSKGFGPTGSRSEVLKDINLAIDKGEFVAIVGLSGAGKTTLISLIAGLLKADSGTVTLNDLEITGPGPDRGIVFQNYSLLPWLTVYENIYLAVEQLFPNWAVTKKQQHVERHIAMVNLTPAREKRPGELLLESATSKDHQETGRQYQQGGGQATSIGPRVQTTGIRAGEQVILSSQSYGTQCALGGVVVHFDLSVVAITQQRSPARESIADGDCVSDFRDREDNVLSSQARSDANKGRLRCWRASRRSSGGLPRMSLSTAYNAAIRSKASAAMGDACARWMS